jgi:hypothetical protein
MRTHVTFRTARFEASPPEHTSVEDLTWFGTPPGRDLAAWLRGELAAAPGLTLEGPVQEEWGWALRVRAGDQGVAVHVGLLAEGPPAWLIVVRPVALLRPGSSGRVDQRGLERVIEALHELLHRAPELHDVAWHDAAVFDRGGTDPAPTPFIPTPPERA